MAGAIRVLPIHESWRDERGQLMPWVLKHPAIYEELVRQAQEAAKVVIPGHWIPTRRGRDFTRNRKGYVRGDNNASKGNSAMSRVRRLVIQDEIIDPYEWWLEATPQWRAKIVGLQGVRYDMAVYLIPWRESSHATNTEKHLTGERPSFPRPIPHLGELYDLSSFV